MEIIIEQLAPDIMCFSEHWLNASEKQCLPGYSMVYNRYLLKNGGMCIMMKTTLNASKLNISNAVQPIQKLFEYTAIEIESNNMEIAFLVM